jgi:hypothetical protein
MQRWEYLVLDFGLNRARSINGKDLPLWERSPNSLADSLNELGQEGWEMVSSLTGDDYTFGRIFLKRPKQERAEGGGGGLLSRAGSSSNVFNRSSSGTQ